MTTSELAEKAIEDVRQMSGPEKVKLRRRLEAEFYKLTCRCGQKLGLKESTCKTCLESYHRTLDWSEKE